MLFRSDKELKEIFVKVATNPIDGEARGMGTTGLTVDLNPSFLINDGYNVAKNTSKTTTLTPSIPINGSGAGITGYGYTVPAPPADLRTTPSSVGLGTSSTTATGAAVTTATSTDSTIKGLYTSLLGRAADTAGLQYWSSMVTSGTLTMTQVADAFKASPEYKNLTGGAKY